MKANRVIPSWRAKFWNDLKVQKTYSRSLLSVLFVSFFASLSAQFTFEPLGRHLFTDTLSLRPLNASIVIDSLNSGCWVVGTPDKGSFTSGHSGSLALLTDSAEAYGMGLNHCFLLDIHWMDSMAGEGILSFYHKYNTDSKKDGGVIEYFKESENAWKDIREVDPFLQSEFFGLPEDTIQGGIYGFSGNQPEWQYVELHWVWLHAIKHSQNDFGTEKLRFRFISDSIATGKEGWMISDLVFRGYSISGSAEEWKNKPVSVFPDPGSGMVTVQLQDSKYSNCTFELIDARGASVQLSPVPDGKVDCSSQKPGMYLYRVYAGGKMIGTGKMMKR